MNIVAIIGNVASEPELRTTSKGRAVCTFRVAVARTDNQQEADFFDVVAWERQAEMCKHFLDVGRRIAVQGRMRCTVTQTDGGERRTRTELVACRVELLSSIPRSTASTSAEPVEVAR